MKHCLASRLFLAPTSHLSRMRFSQAVAAQSLRVFKVRRVGRNSSIGRLPARKTTGPAPSRNSGLVFSPVVLLPPDFRYVSTPRLPLLLQAFDEVEIGESANIAVHVSPGVPSDCHASNGVDSRCVSWHQFLP